MSIENTYQKLEQLDHVLLRPDTYIGSAHKDTARLWVPNDKEGEDFKFDQRNLSFVPGLYKIFDEILVNAADNKVRDSTMNMVKISIDQENGVISVWNNGKGLPVQIHKKHHLYVPEMVFGVLLTSSNYNDDQKKVTGGRNGFGAKLTNIFSKEFTVETFDSASGLLFKKTWKKNMREALPNEINNAKGKDFTCVTFKPDFARFGMERLEDDIVMMMKKRAWDLAGSTPGLTVKLNGTAIPVKDFKAYCELYPLHGAIKNQQYEKPNDRWTVCVTFSDIGYQHVSFVNGIWTYKGGKHVDYITSQVVDRVCEKLKKKKVEVKPNVIRSHLFVFVNCLIENPAFDSQTKETLTTPKTKFGSECKLSEKMLDAICKSDIIEKILEAHFNKAGAQLDKKVASNKSKRLRGIDKLEEANEAGGPRAQQCTLVLTEGDSAKALAISGFSVVGRDYWGVFPLRGKLLNVREANMEQVMKNQEVQNIMKILGLKTGVETTSTRNLRYGHLMIMCDQDHDGSHIKGLLVNFIHRFWPGLLENCPGFLLQFITPIVKITKGSYVKSFYSMPDYHRWFESTADRHKYKIKYYKGLGTSKPEEAKEYFSEMARHRITFDYDKQQDQDSILLAFDKNRADDRKVWLTSFNENENQLDFTQPRITVSDFINKELVLFSRADCERSIPCVVDGLKTSQRKILFCCFKRKGMEKNEIKVAQLSGYVSEHSAYHHGEASLQGAIIGLAQDFVGSNNLNVLTPNGQFGTRIAGGKDASQARYLFTQLSAVTRCLFPALDDELLKYRDDDGVSVEPFWYIPILPLVLINGSRGIGSGYSTYIPQYSPLDLIGCTRAMIAGRQPEPLHPWYRDFKGDFEQNDSGGYRCFGKIRRVSNTVVNITELPIEKANDDYKKSVLEEYVKEELVYDYREHHTDVTVDFEIQMDPETLDAWEAMGLEEKFKLKKEMSTSNMVAFDANGRITRYATALDILKDWFGLRRQFYHKRKDLMVDKLSEDCEKLKNMVRFVLEVVGKELDVMKRKKKDILQELRDRKYKPFPPQKSKKIAKNAIDYEELAEREEEEEEDDTPGAADYDYLLSMKIWSLTYERVEKLKSQLADKEKELSILLDTSPDSMWVMDLDALEEAYKVNEEKRQKAFNSHKKKADSHQAARKKANRRLAESTFTPKQSEKARKAVEAEVSKQRKAEASSKAREARELKKSVQIMEAASAAAKIEKMKATNGTANGLSQASATNGLSQASATYGLSQASIGGSVAASVGASQAMDLDDEFGSAAPGSPARDSPLKSQAASEFEIFDSPPKAPKPPAPKPKPAAKKSNPRPKAAPKPKKAKDSDSESGSDNDDDAPDPVEAPQRATRERKTVKYSMGDNTESEESSSASDESDAPPKIIKAKAKPKPKAAPKPKASADVIDSDEEALLASVVKAASPKTKKRAPSASDKPEVKKRKVLKKTSQLVDSDSDASESEAKDSDDSEFEFS